MLYATLIKTLHTLVNYSTDVSLTDTNQECKNYLPRYIMCVFNCYTFINDNNNNGGRHPSHIEYSNNISNNNIYLRRRHVECLKREPDVS